MLTNEERRKIATRLRRKEPSSFETVFDVFTEIGLAVNPKGGSFKTLPLQLADLIKPEPERTCEILHDDNLSEQYGGPMARCSYCGAALPEEFTGPYHYCPCCGSKNKVVYDAN